MYDIDKKRLEILSNDLNFITNTLEKVLRLIKILNFVFTKESINNMLLLKGGTAINLCLLKLPRLSVDIDFDFAVDCSKNEMLEKLQMIRDIIVDYMTSNDYKPSNRSKQTHTLDSFVFMYDTLSNSTDVLKIEINYSNRCHLFKQEERSTTELLGESTTVHMLNPLELIGSKVSALISRTVPRDVYDVYNLLKDNERYDWKLISNIAILYTCLSEDLPIDFDVIIEKALTKIDSLRYFHLKETIIPVIHKGEQLNVELMKNTVITFIKKSFNLNTNEKEFIVNFNNGNFIPELLVGKLELNEIKHHPMVEWKMNKLK